MLVNIARSSTAETAKRHCNGAARHAEIGTPRDRSTMRIGTAVHHMIHGVATRGENVMPSDAIDQTAADLIANGRRFEDRPVEYIDPERADRARDLALDFLDRREVEALLTGYDWMQAELSTSLDRAWKVVDRGMCDCGHLQSFHEIVRAGPSGAIQGEVCGECSCADFKPAAQWTGTQDLVAIFQEEDPDGQLLKVLLIKDWKGGNISETWFSGVQGKSAAVCGVGINEANAIGADILRREVTSYLPWGGSFQVDLDLHDPDDLDLLSDYRAAILVQIAGNAGRQGKTPDELAEPGAGCSAGFAPEPGCPWLSVCKPYQRQRQRELDAGNWPAADDREGFATVYAVSKAAYQETGKLLRRGLVGPVPTADGLSEVGWKRRGGSRVATNAAMWLAETWVEIQLAKRKGSLEAQERAAILEGVFRAMLPAGDGNRPGMLKAGGTTQVRAIIGAMSDRLEREEIEALEARCIVDCPGRELATWKAGSRPPQRDAADRANPSPELTLVTAAMEVDRLKREGLPVSVLEQQLEASLAAGNEAEGGERPGNLLESKGGADS